MDFSLENGRVFRGFKMATLRCHTEQGSREVLELIIATGITGPPVTCRVEVFRDYFYNQRKISVPACEFLRDYANYQTFELLGFQPDQCVLIKQKIEYISKNGHL